MSLFTFRTLHTNAHTARTLPCPTPAGVKLALLAKLLEEPDADRDPQALLDWLGPVEVWWRAPDRLAISTATVRTYKADGPDQALTASRGMREYVHLGGSFGLAIGPVPQEWQGDLVATLSRLRALGTADSLIQPLGPVAWTDDPPADYANLTPADAADKGDRDTEAGGEVAVVLDDLGTAPQWARLNVYRPPGRGGIPRIGPDRVRRIVTLPLRVVRWRQAGYHLERTIP